MDERVSAALDSFREAKRIMDDFSGGTTATDLVKAVHENRIDRNGRTPAGHEYAVHGIGYTVTLGNGGDVHLDGSQAGEDCFKVYDVIRYLDTAEGPDAPAVAAVVPLLEERVERGELGKLERGYYTLKS